MTDDQFQVLFQGLERFVAKRLDTTDAKMVALEASVDAKIDRLRNEVQRAIHEETKSLSAEFKVDLGATETHILTGVHNMFEPLDARLEANTRGVRTLDIEVLHLKDRIKAVEQKLGIISLA